MLAIRLLHRPSVLIRFVLCLNVICGKLKSNQLWIDCFFAGRPGLEPGMAEPESAVLPIKLSPNSGQKS